MTRAQLFGQVLVTLNPVSEFFFICIIQISNHDRIDKHFKTEERMQN